MVYFGGDSQRIWFSSASNDQGKIKDRVRCWRLVLTEHMVKLLISVTVWDCLMRQQQKDKELQSNFVFNITADNLPQSSSSSSNKKVCMGMIHTIGPGWGGIKASKSMRCTSDQGLRCYYVPWLRETRGFPHKHMHFNTCKLVVEASGEDGCTQWWFGVSHPILSESPQFSFQLNQFGLIRHLSSKFRSIVVLWISDSSSNTWAFLGYWEKGKEKSHSFESWFPWSSMTRIVLWPVTKIQ